MPFREIPWIDIADATKRDVIRRANMYLSDVYAMLRVKEQHGRGGCNFSIALVLLCVVDGIARDIYPTRAVEDDHEKRFRRLLKHKLPWGPTSKKWLDKGQAAKWLYSEFRNPLTHELGKDVSVARRPARQYEPAVHKWGNGVSRMRVDSLDALKQWPDVWPVMMREPYKDGHRVALSGAALYWAVKKLVSELARVG